MITERRKAARLAESLTFRLASDGFDIICDTLNISSNGLLCRVNRLIPPMTRTRLVLVIPNTKDGSRPHQIQADGVVVRTEKDAKNSLWNLAIFFTEISKVHRAILQTYIQNRLTEREFT